MRTRIVGFGALVVALLLVGGAAIASIPAADGTINGCRQDSTGNLRVIDSGETCPSGWSPLNWPSQDRYAYWADGYNVVMSQAIVPANATITVAATCPPSQTAIHGGWSIGTDQDVRIRRWGPSGGNPPAGWFGRFTNHEDVPTTGAVSVLASCVDLNPFP